MNEKEEKGTRNYAVPKRIAATWAYVARRWLLLRTLDELPE